MKRRPKATTFTLLRDLNGKDYVRQKIVMHDGTVHTFEWPMRTIPTMQATLLRLILEHARSVVPDHVASLPDFDPTDPKSVDDFAAALQAFSFEQSLQFETDANGANSAR